MPTVLLLYGIRFFFYPNDHEPIHVHIQYQGHSAKFQVVPDILLIENSGIKPPTLKRAMELIELYREKIISDWHKAFDNRR